MQPQANADKHAQFPIQELEQIESAIRASQDWLATLTARREKLTADLERITRPQPTTLSEPVQTIGPGLEYRGVMSEHWNYIDIHIDLLRRLWTDFPDRREAMTKAIACCGTSRSYVAKTLTELFPGRSTAWARRYSRTLVEGWFVDTNLNRERMDRILPCAVEAAGLKWGEDVRPYWHRTKVADERLAEQCQGQPAQLMDLVHAPDGF